MFGLVGKMFGSDKALDAAISGVTKGLDALVYTDEEKAGDAAKERAEARSMIVSWQSATSGQNLARRFIALAIVFIWLLQYVAAMVLSLISVWMGDPVLWQDSADIVGNYAERMNGAVMLILGFYFAAPHLSGIVGAALNKFEKPNKAATKGMAPMEGGNR